MCILELYKDITKVIISSETKYIKMILIQHVEMSAFLIRVFIVQNHTQLNFMYLNYFSINIMDWG